MTTQTIDTAKAELFAGRMVGILSDASLAVQCSIGHQVGLFDTMAGRSPSTSAQIAEAAGLNERYVREWLGALTTGGIVEYEPGADTYRLPPEHATALTRAAGPDNLARMLQFIPLMGEMEQRVVECFRRGGGVDYSAFTRFHTLMFETSGEIFDAALIDTVLPLAPGVPGRLAEGIDVADVGCGSGRAVNLIARTYPDSSITGYDFSESALEHARAEAASLGLPNARFELCDVAELGAVEAFDLITAFDAIHDQAHPDRVLANAYRALRPGGTFLMVDINASSHVHENTDLPWAPFFYTISTLHCMTVSLALGGAGLGTVWGRQRALGMLDDAGFSRVEVHEVQGDPFNAYYVADKD